MGMKSGVGKLGRHDQRSMNAGRFSPSTSMTYCAPPTLETATVKLSPGLYVVPLPTTLPFESLTSTSYEPVLASFASSP